jgi:hypothetical protein
MRKFEGYVTQRNTASRIRICMLNLANHGDPDYIVKTFILKRAILKN